MRWALKRFEQHTQMDKNSDSQDARAGGIPTQVMEITVALVFLALGGLVVFDSIRLGMRWAADGPESGYFPFYVDLFKKVRETPEWKKFMQDGAFTQTFMSGKEYADWVAKAETLHRGLMKEAGFLAKK